MFQPFRFVVVFAVALDLKIDIFKIPKPTLEHHLPTELGEGNSKLDYDFQSQLANFLASRVLFYFHITDLYARAISPPSETGQTNRLVSKVFAKLILPRYSTVLYSTV